MSRLLPKVMMNQMTAALDQMIVPLIPPRNQIAKWNQVHKSYGVLRDSLNLPLEFFSLGNINNVRTQNDVKARNGRPTTLD